MSKCSAAEADKRAGNHPFGGRAGFLQGERKKMADRRKGRGVAQGLRSRAVGCGLCSRGKLECWQVCRQRLDKGQWGFGLIKGVAVSEMHGKKVGPEMGTLGSLSGRDSSSNRPA